MKKRVNVLLLTYRVLGVFIAVTLLLLSVFAVSFYVVKKRYPLGYKEQVLRYAEVFDLQPAFVFSVIKTESDFRVNAKSNKGAIGLMQIKEQTAKYIAERIGVKEYDLYILMLTRLPI